MRRQIVAVVTGIAVTVVAPLGTGVALARSTAPSVRPSAGGYSIPLVKGTPAHVGVMLDPKHDVRLREVDIDLPRGLRGGALLGGRLPSGAFLGATTGDEIPEVTAAPEGALIPAHSEFQQLYLSFVSDVPGVYRVDGLTISSGSWLTGRRERLDTDICIVVVDSEGELDGATDACDPE